MTHILVIDADDESRNLVRTLLGGAGYEVYEACDGRAAVACCQVHAIDLVLTDILMPEPGGFAMIRALRRFCQLVETDIVTRQTGTLLRSSPPFRRPALYL